jgi:hypothetical protein
VAGVTEPDRPGPDGPAATPLPFVAAVVVVGALVVLAYVFLRPDEEGRVVRPDRFAVVDDHTVVATAADEPACERIERAQYDLDETQIYLELVAVEVEGCDDADERVDLEVEIDLGTGIDDRELVPGAGRTRVPCSGTGRAVTCRPPR